MASLQAQALAALTVSRKGTVKKATSQQEGMVGSEESMRAKASKEAKDIFDTTQTQVNGLLKDLASKAMNDWEAAKKILVSNFKAELLPIQQRVEKRHSGVGGWFVGKWDAVTGLPSWAKEGYTKAEKNFGAGVIAKLTEISTRVNSITCRTLSRQHETTSTKTSPLALQRLSMQCGPKSPTSGRRQGESSVVSLMPSR